MAATGAAEPAAPFAPALYRGRALSVGLRTREGRRRLPAHWPITACIGLFPLWWALGAGAFIWPVFAVPLAFRLLVVRRPIKVPIGFGLWLVWVGWVVLSYFGLEGAAFPFAYMWRLSNYISCTIFFLAISHADEDEIPSKHLVRLLSGFWVVTIVGGWLGVIMPNGTLPSMLGRVLPAKIAADPFVSVLVTPKFAQVQEVLGYPLGRPQAPFIYTNDWGSAYALLLPFFFLYWLAPPNDSRRRSWGYLMMMASLVPVFISLNRGLWLGLGVALIYASGRRGAVAATARRAVIALVVIGLLIIAFTPIGSVVEGRAEHDHSSQGRFFLYEQSFQFAAKSPIIGLGGPRPYGGSRIIPLVGTQGFIWMVLVSTGYIGLLIFLSAWGRILYETRRGPPVTFWCHVVIVIAAVQMFVYDLIPSALHVVFIAAALGYRAARAAPPDDSPELESDDLALPAGVMERRRPMTNVLRSDDAALAAVVEVLSPRHSDGGVVRRYAVLPRPSRPRYFVPVEARHARGAYIRPPIAHGRGPRSRAVLAQFLALGGGRLMPGTVRVPDGTAADPSLRRHLTTVLDREDIDVVVALGAPRANRKPVIQVIAADGSTVAWVKLGVDDYTDSLVAHETDALSRPPGPPVAVPPLLASGAWHDHRYLALGHLDITQTGEDLDLTADVVRAIAGEVTRESVKASPWWSHLRDVARDRHADPTDSIGSLLDVLEPDIASREWAFGTWHGDLAPWNARSERGQLHVWDWERCMGPVPLGLDLMHNRFQLAMLRDSAQPGPLLEAAAAAETATLEQLGYDRDESWLVAMAYAATLHVRLAEDSRFGPLGSAASAMADAIDTDPVLRKATR